MAVRKAWPFWPKQEWTNRGTAPIAAIPRPRRRRFTRTSATPGRKPAAITPTAFSNEALGWSGTFHAIGARLVRQHARDIGLDPAFTILDREDAAGLIDLVRHALGFSLSAGQCGDGPEGRELIGSLGCPAHGCALAMDMAYEGDHRPPYCPELNPVERFGGLLKAQVRHRR